MRRTILVSSLVSSVVTIFVLFESGQRVMTPARVAAQPEQLQEVRASKFTLVAADGTVVGAWESEPSQQVTRGGVTATPLGGGRLTVFNSLGKQRLRLNPNGIFAVYDEDGQRRALLPVTCPRLSQDQPAIRRSTGCNSTHRRRSTRFSARPETSTATVGVHTRRHGEQVRILPRHDGGALLQHGSRHNIAGTEPLGRAARRGAAVHSGPAGADPRPSDGERELPKRASASRKRADSLSD